MRESDPVRPNEQRNFFIQGIAFSLPKQRFGTPKQKIGFSQPGPNRCFGREKAIP